MILQALYNYYEAMNKLQLIYGRKNKKYNPTKQKVQFETW